MEFGGYNWLVLEVNQDKVLLLTEIAIENSNNIFTDASWSDSKIRNYLNGAFLEKFSEDDRKRILDTNVINNNNPWCDTDGGDATTDKIFLLSLEEVVLYFGDSGQLKNLHKDAYRINDKYNTSRIAYNKAGEASSWWLRSPGSMYYYATYVDGNGEINVSGEKVYDPYICIRPALWLKLQ